MSNQYPTAQLISLGMAEAVQEYLLTDGDTLGEAILAIMAARRAQAAIMRAGRGDATPQAVHALINELETANDALTDLLGSLYDELELTDDGPGIQHTGETVPDAGEIQGAPT